jgi:microcin C transport system substrate-binding protein
LAEEVFGEAFVPPETDGSGRDRAMLRRASDLLAEAGWKLDGNRLVDDAGTQLTVEFLIDAVVFERVTAPYVENLRRIGISASIRQVDPVQAQARQTDFDFDIVMFATSSTATPIDSQRQAFSSEAADTPGSYNYSGIKNPAVDALIDNLPQVTSRHQLIAVLRSIDRVLRAGHYWVPNWYLPYHRVAYWDVFDWPSTKPDYAFEPELIWWFDDDKARAIGYSA